MQARKFERTGLAHAAAAGAALCYAWLISNTALVTSGMQFIAPLLIILAVHLGWMALSGLRPGFSVLVLRRGLHTSIAMATVVFFGSMIAPMPTHADAGDLISGILVVFLCLAVLTLVVVVPIAILYLMVRGLCTYYAKRKGGAPESRFFDGASLGVVAVILLVGSFEGVLPATTFKSYQVSTAMQHVNAPPERVWQVLQTATAPEFPLPGALGAFPRPVAVTVDEGTDLGAMRQVLFRGREGEGRLTLKVVERGATRAIFEVQSDTSPIAAWIAHKRLIYAVNSTDAGTELSVSLEFERRLAPRWFFGPMMQGASYLAMDVLARDVKTRAEL